MDLESMSKPDDLDLDDNGEEGDGVEVEMDAEANEDYEPLLIFNQRTRVEEEGVNKSDTEDDAVGPITPGPGSNF
jgi:hypothetical protein